MNKPRSGNPFDAAPIILSALAISAIGALFYNVLPLYLGVAQDSRQLDNQQIGFISTAFFSGYNAVTIWAFFWIRRWSWRTATLVALPIALLGLLGAAWSSNYVALLASTVVAGGGFAAIYGIGTTVLADTSNPARWYGVKIAAEALPGAILLFLLPSTLIEHFGFAGMAYGMVAVALLLTPFLLNLPAQGIKALAEVDEEDLEVKFAKINPGAIWSALAATFLFFSAASGMWAFIERLGVSGGFDQQRISILLAITLLFATGGSLVTAWLGERFGNVRPFFISCVIFLAGTGSLALTTNFEIYALGTCLITFAIGMGLPFAVAEVAELDTDGRFVILSVPAIGTGAMLGPGLAGILSAGGVFSGVLVAATIGIIASAALMFYSDRAR